MQEPGGSSTSMPQLPHRLLVPYASEWATVDENEMKCVNLESFSFQKADNLANGGAAKEPGGSSTSMPQLPHRPPVQDALTSVTAGGNPLKFTFSFTDRSFPTRRGPANGAATVVWMWTTRPAPSRPIQRTKTGVERPKRQNAWAKNEKFLSSFFSLTLSFSFFSLTLFPLFVNLFCKGLKVLQPWRWFGATCTTCERSSRDGCGAGAACEADPVKSAARLGRTAWKRLQHHRTGNHLDAKNVPGSYLPRQFLEDRRGAPPVVRMRATRPARSRPADAPQSETSQIHIFPSQIAHSDALGDR